MKNRCFNYKFFLLFLFPLLGTILSANLLIFSQGTVFWGAFFIILLSISNFLILFAFEPIYYIITQNEIQIVCFFKRYIFEWQQIDYIEIHFDTFFEFLFIKNYILIYKTQSKEPTRRDYIMKYSKTKKLIEKYGNLKIRR